MIVQARWYLYAFVTVRTGNVALFAQTGVSMTEVTPNLLVFSTTAGNVVASVGTDQAFLVGTAAATSTAQINRMLAD